MWASAATLASPGLRVLLRQRARRGKEAPHRLGERLGRESASRPAGPLLWLHAASVCESVSILPVLSVLARREPALSMLLTTGTVTSAELLGRRLPELGLSDRVIHRFVPLDVPRWVARFLDHWRPDAAAFIESELWPNLLAGCHTRRIPVMLVNARLSATSEARWRRVSGMARHVLGCFEFVQAQSADDAERLAALGAKHVMTAGNLKFAAPPLPADEAELARLRGVLAGRPCWLAASTHPGEETLVLAAHRLLAPDHPGLVSIIVPRHRERGPRIAAECGQTAVALRSKGHPPPAEGILIGDTLGELGLWYRLAGIALIGRSLVPPGGGQNPLEAARLGCVVAAGPLMSNFADAVQTLGAAGALTRVTDTGSISRFVADMLARPERRAAIAGAGAQAVARYADLPDRTAGALLDLLARSR